MKSCSMKTVSIMAWFTLVHYSSVYVEPITNTMGLLSLCSANGKSWDSVEIFFGIENFLHSNAKQKRIKLSVEK